MMQQFPPHDPPSTEALFIRTHEGFITQVLECLYIITILSRENNRTEFRVALVLALVYQGNQAMHTVAHLQLHIGGRIGEDKIKFISTDRLVQRAVDFERHESKAILRQGCRQVIRRCLPTLVGLLRATVSPYSDQDFLHFLRRHCRPGI